MPIFYLPTPDPTNIDVQNNNVIALQFSEAAISERIGANGSLCDGLDPMSPLCARVLLRGQAVPIVDPQELSVAQTAFSKRHPYADWLAHGGAHTGGRYYTIEIHEIQILDYFGGATRVPVEDYLSVDPKHGGETANESGKIALEKEKK